MTRQIPPSMPRLPSKDTLPCTLLPARSERARWPLALTLLSLFSATACPPPEGQPADVGSGGCREAHLAVLDTVAQGEPYADHRQLMRAVADSLEVQKKRLRITEQCAACMKELFEDHVPPDQQALCGTHPVAREIQDSATNNFLSIRDLIDPEDQSTTKAKFIQDHVQIESDKWVYVLTASGEQVFRAKSVYPHVEPSLSEDITPFLDDWLKRTTPDPSLVAYAKRIAREALGVDYTEHSAEDVTTRRELIQLVDLRVDGRPTRHHEGRTLVMFANEKSDQPTTEGTRTTVKPDPRTGAPILLAERVTVPLRPYETSISLAQGKVVGIHADSAAPEVQGLSNRLRDGFLGGLIDTVQHESSAETVFSTFYQPDEWRFQFSSNTWGGEPFVTRSEGPINPYGRSIWESPENFVDTYCPDSLSLRDYPLPLRRLGLKYAREYWSRWDELGRKNGVRGNCRRFVGEADKGECEWWENGLWTVRHHDMGDYASWCAPGTLASECYYRTFFWPDDLRNSIEELPFCPHLKARYEWGHGRRLDERFFLDLEGSHVAVISAHSGPVWNRYQFNARRGIWAVLHAPGLQPLGAGNLRHLFLSGCASMNWKQQEPELYTEWLRPGLAGGIRSIFGTDGAWYGHHFEGLVFFRFYNLGFSISESWAMMATDLGNFPVAVGYGDDPFDALARLLDERFKTTRAGNREAVAARLVP